MEVHAHTHTARKKWTHYLWEFLMLFLAVFCGFLAEYQLEHKIERDRERQYIKSLLLDLRSDTAQLTRLMNFRINKMRNFDTIMLILKSKNWKNNTASIYNHSFYAPFANKFLPNNGVLLQLKNAGGLRLLRNTIVTDSLLNYDIQTQWVTDFEVLERDRFIDQSPWEKVLDASVFEENLVYQYPHEVFTLNRINGNPALLSENKEDLDRFYNRVQMQKRVNAVVINRFFVLRSQSARLIELIKKEYSIN
jgi:hypothetical protein